MIFGIGSLAGNAKFWAATNAVHHGGVPAMEHLMGFLRQIEHVQDNVQRQPGRKIVHNVDFTLERRLFCNQGRLLHREFFNQRH